MFKYILIFLLSTSSVLAHSWYPTECCSDKDCKPIPCESIGEDAKGNLTYNGFTFTKDKEHPSKDSSCHVCIFNGNAPICIFTIQGS